MEELPLPEQPKHKISLCYCLKAGVPVIMMKSIDESILVGRCQKCKKLLAEKVKP